VNICLYCKKYKRCSIRERLTAGALSADVQSVFFEVSVTKCKKFVRSEELVEVRHICSSCSKQGSCKLWEQVSNTDEDYLKELYDINIWDEDVYQNVGVTVIDCRLWTPDNNI